MLRFLGVLILLLFTIETKIMAQDTINVKPINRKAYQYIWLDKEEHIKMLVDYSLHTELSNRYKRNIYINHLSGKLLAESNDYGRFSELFASEEDFRFTNKRVVASRSRFTKKIRPIKVGYSTSDIQALILKYGFKLNRDLSSSQDLIYTSNKIENVIRCILTKQKIDLVYSYENLMQLKKSGDLISYQKESHIPDIQHIGEMNRLLFINDSQIVNVKIMNEKVFDTTNSSNLHYFKTKYGYYMVFPNEEILSSYVNNESNRIPSDLLSILENKDIELRELDKTFNKYVIDEHLLTMTYKLVISAIVNDLSKEKRGQYQIVNNGGILKVMHDNRPTHIVEQVVDEYRQSIENCTPVSFYSISIGYSFLKN